MIMVDELRAWPHAHHQCFKAGSAHLTVESPSTVDDLHAFATRLGLRRAWFQPAPKGGYGADHYDLSSAKHALALSFGAQLVPAREQARRRAAKRQSLSRKE